MDDKNDFSEFITDSLLELRQHGQELQKHSSILGTVVDVQERMLQTQEKIVDRLDRNEAGFNAFAGTVLDHLSDIKADLRGIRTTVFQDHEERLRRLEDFMRRAG